MNDLVGRPQSWKARRNRRWTIDRSAAGLSINTVDGKSSNKLAATADLSGGHIRNVVLTAAVQAQSQQRPIAYPDILVGLMAELRKLGRQVPPELRTEA